MTPSNNSVIPIDNYQRNNANTSNISSQNSIVSNYSSNKVEEQMSMDILEKYIDKMDRDQSDLRNDIRASEERTERRIERLEKLMTDQSQRIENKIDSIETKFDSWNKWIIGTCLATIIGIATMVITVLVAG